MTIGRQKGVVPDDSSDLHDYRTSKRGCARGDATRGECSRGDATEEARQRSEEEGREGRRRRKEGQAKVNQKTLTRSFWKTNRHIVI